MNPSANGGASLTANPASTPTAKPSIWGDLPQHVMSGISRMVPTLIMGGVILAFSQLIAYAWLDVPLIWGFWTPSIPASMLDLIYP